MPIIRLTFEFSCIMTIDEAQRSSRKLLSGLYESREASTITDWLLEKLTGWQKIDRIVRKNHVLTPAQENFFYAWTAELRKGRPVQYVLEEADFLGLRFFVDENVLIPRPETEELVTWMLEAAILVPESRLSVLDIGTGSGCIPISVTLRSPSSVVSACDISEGALNVARRNATRLNASVDFFQQDILDDATRSVLPIYDMIVSNPPYIPEKDKAAMRINVLAYEPQLALFTGNEDPYIFYRNISVFATQHLSKKGQLFFEIHESGGDEVMRILRDQRFESIELKNDMFDKPRMIRALWPG